MILFLFYKYIELINKTLSILEFEKATFNKNIRLVILMTKKNSNVCKHTELKNH